MTAAVRADDAVLVRDIGEKVPYPWETLDNVDRPWWTAMEDAVYFLHDDGIHGQELWRSDGTSAGTWMVRDLCPGSCGSAKWNSWDRLERVGEILFFAGDDGVHGVELWRTDGTASGTVLVADLVPGLASGRPSGFTRVGALLFFNAELDGKSVLWRSDGTVGGTVPVPGAAAKAGWPRAEVGGRLVYAIRSFDADAGLWATDGTVEGTEKLAAVEVAAQVETYKSASWSVLPNGVLLFAASEPVHGRELWRSNGTVAGTQLVVDLVGGAEGVYSMGYFTVVGGEIYFTVYAPGIGSGPLLAHSDGTAEGTLVVPLPAGLQPSVSFGRLAPAGDQLVFAAFDAEHGAEPWVTDGVTTTLLRDIRPGPDSSLPYDDWSFWWHVFAGTGPRTVFTANDGIHGPELWTTDGSAPGTHLLAELVPGGGGMRSDSLGLAVAAPVFAGGILLREFSPDFGQRLWFTDGTTPNTRLTRVVRAHTSAFRHDARGLFFWAPPPADCLTTVRGRLLFAAEDGFFGSEPWVTTPAGDAMLLADLAPGGGYSFPRACASFRGHAIFSTEVTDAAGNSIAATWSSDGESPPALLAQTAGWFPHRPFAASFGDALYLLSGDLLRTDGTAAGTQTIAPADTNCGVEELAHGGDTLYVADCGLSKSDGTPGSMTAVETLEGEPLSSVAGLRRIGPNVLFAASDDAGSELWVTDGSGFAQRLVDIHPGVASGMEWEYELYGPVPPATTTAGYFFVADDGTHGDELWASDGTAPGTRLVVDLFPGSYPSSPRELVTFGSYVYFIAESPAHGRELWRSDGTTKGTELVADLVPGGGSSLPQQLTVTGGALWFSAWTSSHGREPWRISDPGAAPVRVADIAPGAQSSSPIRFHGMGGSTYVVANDNSRGFELWRIAPVGLLFADGLEGGDVEEWNDVEGGW